MLFLMIFFIFVSHLDTNGVVWGANFPSEIQFCHKSDNNFNICVATQMTKCLRIFKDGFPELGIPKLEPFKIPEMEIIGDPSSSVSMSQKYTNSLTHGVSTSELYDAKYVVNEDECYFDFMVLTPTAFIEADYEFNGQMLVFPVNGHGKSNITLTNLRNHHQAQCQLYKKNGDTYIKLTKYQMDMRAEKIVYYFENLVPGNQQLSDQILQTMNENAQEIFSEVKFGFETVWGQLHLRSFNSVIAKFPEAVLFPA